MPVSGSIMADTVNGATNASDAPALWDAHHEDGVVTWRYTTRLYAGPLA